MGRTLALLALGLAATQARASAFGPAEQMTFHVSYLGIHAGKMQLTVGAPARVDQGRIWPILVFARTEALFSLFPVRDKFVSLWDPAAHRSLGSDFFADEGNRRRRLKVDFKPDQGKARVLREFEDAPGSDDDWDVEPGSFDMCAAVYALREYALEEDDEVELPVFTGRNSFLLRAKVGGTETVAVPIGTFVARRVTLAATFLGKFETTGDIGAWMTDDERHLPLRVDASFKLGTLSAVLADYRRGLAGERFGATPKQPEQQRPSGATSEVRP